jgi:ATP-binding cassette, subfamily F, member 3
MITLKNIQIMLGGREIIKGVDLNVRDGECLAVVGPNGCGKSTLIKIIAGLIEPDDGEIYIPNKTTIGYLPQEADLMTDRPVEEELLTAFADVQAALDQMQQVEHEMGRVDPDSAAYEQLMKKYAGASHIVEHNQGYSLETQTRKIGSGLGFSDHDMTRPCSEFSGGWQMRILLAKILLQKPDVILLDEPTNYLDLESMLWLENWIRTSQRTVVMVSHERIFMDRLVDRIVSLERGRADIYTGGYSSYIEQSRQKHRAQWDAYTRQRKEIEKMEHFIRRFRAKNTLAARVQSRIKQLEKIERIEPPFHPEAIYFQFPPATKSYHEVIKTENLGHSYGDHQVLSDINITITSGQKIGLVGKNGSGKSTLMRLLSLSEKPTRGGCKLGGNVKMAYFSQYDVESLISGNSLLQTIESSAPIGQQSRARDVLGAFLFSGDDVEKPLKALSGGERTRLRLAQLLFSPANLLLLDEPTNHLDITSRATVEEALRKYTGTLIVVSHDRFFMDRVTDRIIEIEDGNLIDYPGTYSEYLHHKQQLMNIEELDSLIPGKAAVPTDKEQRLLEREQQRKQQRKQRSIEREIEELEKTIHHQEEQIEELTNALIAPDIATNHTELARLAKERTTISDQHNQNLQHWETLHHQLETLKND